jgi:hypothetical protein
MFGLLDWVKIGCGALAGALVAGAAMYWAGTIHGKHEAEIAQLQSSVKAEAKRKGIDNEVDASTQYQLCLAVGGLSEQCAELRGLAEATQGK